MKGNTANYVLNLTRIVCPLCNKEKFLTKFVLRHHIKHKHSEEEAEIFIEKALKEL